MAIMICALPREPTSPWPRSQARQFASSRGRRFLGCKRIGRHPQELRHEPVGTLALALKIRPVTSSRFFNLGQLHLQRLDPDFEGQW
jgi:hypothetical protein